MIPRVPALDCDVVVIGGGIAGFSTALALVRSAGVSVHVLERAPAPPPAPDPDPDPKALAITVASRNVLAAIGAWPRLPADRIGRIGAMQIWEPGAAGRIGFDAADIGAESLGWIVESRLLVNALEAAAGAERGLVLRRGAQVSALAADGEVQRIELADGTRLRARMVVGADGAGSHTRTLAGIGWDRQPYDQEAVVCAVRTASPHADIARQAFLPHGPLAFLPLAGPDLSAIVWSTEPLHAAHLCAIEPARFRAELEVAFDSTLGEVTWSGMPERWPLGLGRAERYVEGRLALVGDAAHVVHPLAGQGANLGLMDAAALAECVAAGIQAGRAAGAPRDLCRYERWRRGENALMQTACDWIGRLYRAESAPLRTLRDAGLRLVDAADPIKALIMRRASGFAGDLPALARADH
ncbi:MAG: FAD-dependent oxidoreductase [Gammaproteobacteria bacterium]